MCYIFCSLVQLVQRAEIALVDPSVPQLTKKGTTVTSASASKHSKAKSVTKVKPASPKLKKDEAIEVSTLQYHLLL